MFSLFLEYVLHLYQVHAMLDFAEDLEECRKIQFAKFVLFFSVDVVKLMSVFFALFFILF